MDFSGTNPRLKEKAIVDDAAFDGCYRLVTTVDRPDAELAAAYLRFHDVAADAARLSALCPPSGQAAVGRALLLVHEVERRSDRSWRDIVAAMDGRYEVAADDGHISRTPPTAAQEDILDAVHGRAAGTGEMRRIER